MNKNMYSNRGLTMVSLLVIVSVIAFFILSLFLVRVRTIEGNEVGVAEDWDGVRTEPVQPGTHFFIFSPTYGNVSLYPYDMGIQVYVMNNKDTGEEYGEGRKGDAYVVQSRDQQDMSISLRIQWRRLPSNVVELHKYARDQVEEKVIRPALLNIVKNHATTRTALEAYSGAGLVQLQDDILQSLKTDPELSKFIIVDGFVIEHIGLDKKYTDEIVARQIAVQTNLKNIELTNAAESAAEKAKAEARADYEKILVEARRDKEKGILDAERVAQQQVLAAEASAKQVSLQAEAEKNRNVLIAQGEKEAAINRAEAIEALGKAEAEAKKLALSAYAVPGADAFVKIEVAKSMSDAFKNIAGYLPEGMTVNLLADQYNKGVNLLVNGSAGNE